MIALTLLALGCALIPTVLFLCNLREYRAPVRLPADQSGESISVLIPARNEEATIAAALRSVLANRDAHFEVVVLDDQSTDRTAAIVRGFAQADARVRLEDAPPLPPGWCGKQHACAVLAARASHPLLCFMDADVRLAPDALSRLRSFPGTSGAALASGVPRQELGTFWERLLIPLIHFVLLSYLPIFWMRRNTSPAFAAGCGQLFLARADAYRKCGGHKSMGASLHDGVKLPRVFRRAGFKTDLFDATEVATCRMYQRGSEVFAGLAKNAVEGLAAPARILPITALLFCGQVLPFLLLFYPGLPPVARTTAAVAVGLALLPRLLAVRRFAQPWSGALLHPLGIGVLLGIQWYALVNSWRGRPATWRGRSYFKPASVALFLAAALPAFSATTNVLANRIGSFELKDQHGQLRQYHFPKTNLSFVVVADQKGSDQIDAWIRPMLERYGRRVAIDGVADVSTVPVGLRSMVRRAFVKKVSYPVMLDWEGKVCPQFSPRKDIANVFVLALDGKIVEQWSGIANQDRLRALFALLDAHLEKMQAVVN